jgi:hypothetical protein
VRLHFSSKKGLTFDRGRNVKILEPESLIEEIPQQLEPRLKRYMPEPKNGRRL